MVGAPGPRALLSALLAALWAFAGAGRVPAQPRDLEAWIIATTAHFEVRSNAGPERAAEVASALETLRAAFAGLAPEIALRSPAPTRIFAFRDATAFAPYRTLDERDGALVLGQFLSHADGNTLMLDADPRYVGALAVIFHEYVHDLVQHNFPGVPRWFNEGLAEYYSTFAIEGGRAIIGRAVPRHLQWLARNADLGLDEILAAGPDPKEHAGGSAGRFYAVSWGLVHYLLSDGGEGSEALARLLAGALAGDRPLDAFEEAFGRRPAELEEELERYLRAGELPIAALPLESLRGSGEARVRPAGAAEVLAPLGDLLAHLGRESEAERHFDLALTLEPGAPGALSGLAYVRDRQGRLAEAEELHRQALAAEPSNALPYVLYGRHLLELARGGGWDGDGADVAELAERAEAALGTATGLDPDFGTAWALRARAHLFGDLDPRQGAAHGERARRLQPTRGDVLLDLVRLYARAGELERAGEIARGDLRRFAGPEIAAQGEEEVERWLLIHAADDAFLEGDYERGLDLLDRAVSVTSDPVLRAEMEERLAGLRRQVSR